MVRKFKGELETLDANMLDSQNGKPEYKDEEKVVFYGNPICPFAARAWIVLLEKEVDHYFTHVGLSLFKPDFYPKEIYAASTVPVIVDGGKIIPESKLVVEYLLYKYADKGNKTLFPTDAYEIVKLRQFESLSDKLIGPLYGALGNNGTLESRKESIDKVTKLLKDFSDALEVNEGPYALGKDFTIADAFIYPFIDRFSETLKKFENFDILKEFKTIAAWVKECRKRKSIQIATRDPHDYTHAYGLTYVGKKGGEKWEIKENEEAYRIFKEQKK